MGRGPTESYYLNLHKDYVPGSLTCLKPETIKSTVSRNFPRVMTIEPTNRCNMKCTYCPRDKADKGVGIMEWEVYQRLIDEIALQKPLIMLHLFKDGESQLHPQFFDMVRYAKDKGAAEKIHINTTAVLWSDKVIQKFLDCGIDDITVSIDAARPETYKEAKLADVLPKVEQNVNRFFEMRDRLNRKHPHVRVKIMEYDGISKEELQEFFEKWDGVADEVQVTGIHSWSGAIKGLKISDESSPQRSPCALMWYSLVVNWDGAVTVCSVDWNTEIKVGDVHRQTLAEIWNSPEIKAARRAHIENKHDTFDVCKECVVWVPFTQGDTAQWLAEQKEYYT